MIIGIIVVFSITFTSINAINCIENPTCKCSSPYPDEISIACNVNKRIGYTVNFRSNNILRIICRNWRGWDNFHINNRLSELTLQVLTFEECGISDEIILKDVVKQLGVKETRILIFKSFHSLFAILKRKHLQGFQSVKTLVLSNNGIINIPNDLLWDLPELEYIDLSKNHFEPPIDIFKATPNLKQIKLFSCGMDKIHAGIFNNLTKLESLDLMSNYLTEIKEGTFNQLVSLKSLNLGFNKLMNLPVSIFRGLKKLEHIDISANNFSYIPSNLLDQNKELKKFYLYNNARNLKTLPNFLLANLTKLNEVYLNRNGFEVLPEDLFWGSPSIEYIVLDNNNLSTLPKNFFRDLTKVKDLSLKGNRIHHLPDKIFIDMENLLKLNLAKNQLFRISRDLFFGLVSLTELNLERNQISILDPAALVTLINLKIAKFSHNPLHLPYISQKLSIFYSNQNLQLLFLSNCSLTSFFEDWKIGNSNLEYIDLTHNLISNITTTTFFVPSRHITIDLADNKITAFHLDKIEEEVSWRKENRNIYIYIKHNPILCDCKLYDILRFRDGKMSSRVYSYFSIDFGNLMCLQADRKTKIAVNELYSDTYQCLEYEYFKTKKLCQDNCICNVRPSDQTRILDCSYKNMSKFVIDKEKVMFEKDTPLIINLTGNFLTEIPSTEPLSPLKVKGLLLSNNKISTLTLDKLPRSLKLLELHNNSISTINFEVIEYLESISWEKLTLSGNPIKCDCNINYLYPFVQSHRIYYEDLNNLICEDKQIPVHRIENIPELCSHSLLFYVIISLLIVVLITIVIFMVINRGKITPWLARKRTEYSVYFTRRNVVED